MQEGEAIAVKRSLLALLILSLGALSDGALSDAGAQQPGPSTWVVSCNENAVTTQIMCSASRRADGVPYYTALSVAIVRTKSGRWAQPLVHVLNDWPGNELPAVLRIDQNSPIVFTRERIASNHSDIIEQMLKGKTARAQTSKWPSCRECRQWEVSLDGFAKALEDLKTKASALGWPRS